MGISERLREAINSKGMNLKEFSSKSGLNYRTLQHYLSGQRSISTEFATQLCEQFGVSATWLLTGYGPMHLNDVQNAHTNTPEFVSIQRFDVSASAGGGSLVEAEIGTGHYAFNRSWLQRRGLTPNNLSVIAVRGDSMEPELYDQDLILLDRSQTQPRDGDMYVVRYSDELFVKRVQTLPLKRLGLKSTNRFYDTIEIKPDEATDLKFIGKVVASMHEW